MIAGILLVTAMLLLNMTVAVGLINGFIFYANIVAAGSTALFPSSEPSFPSFPVYIISLVIAIIIVSEYSPRFARLIGRKDPVLPPRLHLFSSHIQNYSQ